MCVSLSLKLTPPPEAREAAVLPGLYLAQQRYLVIFRRTETTSSPYRTGTALLIGWFPMEYNIAHVISGVSSIISNGVYCHNVEGRVGRWGEPINRLFARKYLLNVSLIVERLVIHSFHLSKTESPIVRYTLWFAAMIIFNFQNILHQAPGYSHFPEAGAHRQ